MDYRVIVTPEAQTRIEFDLAYFRRRAVPEVADRWFAGLIEAIASLARMPMRCAVIPEQWMFDVEHRQLLYGRKGNERRIIFIIDRDTVRVVHYRHSSLPPLSGPDRLVEG